MRLQGSASGSGIGRTRCARGLQSPPLAIRSGAAGARRLASRRVVLAVFLTAATAITPMRARGAEPAPVWRGAPPRDSLRSPAIAAPPVVGALTLERAIGLALRFHSALAESSWLVRSTAARAQESRWANPTLEGLAENFGGSVGSGHTETTVSLSQPIDVTGARRARVDVATGLERLAEMDLSSREREVVAATEASYLDVWWIEQRLVHVGRSAAIARTPGGRRPRAHPRGCRASGRGPARRDRGRPARDRAPRPRGGPRRGAAAARARLGRDHGRVRRTLALPLPTVPALPTSAELIADLEKNPERMRAAIETSVALARVHEARASRFPRSRSSAASAGSRISTAPGSWPASRCRSRSGTGTAI